MKHRILVEITMDSAYLALHYLLPVMKVLITVAKDEVLFGIDPIKSLHIYFKF